MALSYPPFAACQAMEAAARNAPPLRRGAKGLAVSLLQSGLLRVGETLPQSIKPSGVPDGAFGSETEKAVMSYQTKKKLWRDGVAGERTVKALDADMVNAMPSPPPSSPLVPVMPSTPHYTIDLEGMVNEVPSAKARYEDEVAQAQDLVEKLPVGRYDIHSRIAENGYNRQAESRNWFFAIGGYTKWGEGTVTVKNNAGVFEYELDFVYKFYDRCNWDAGKSVTFTWKKGGTIPTSQLYASGGR